MAVVRFINSALKRARGRTDEWHETPDGRRVGLRLYHFSTCPYCLRVRLAIAYMGLSIPLRNIYLRARNRAELISGGGRKTVPCLRIENTAGRVRWMYESKAIIAYLKQLS